MNTPRNSWWMCAARFFKAELAQNAILYTHFLTWSRSLTSMTGVTNAMYIYIGVNHVIIT